MNSPVMKWTSSDEIAFLQTIGRHSAAGSYRTETELLTKYIEGAELRHDWAEIDKLAVLDFCRKQLRQLMATDTPESTEGGKRVWKFSRSVE